MYCLFSTLRDFPVGIFLLSKYGIVGIESELMETGGELVMKLFEVLPERFFQLLVGPNKQLYAEAGILIYEQSQRERFGIRYDVMRDLLQELIETQQELGISFNPNEEDPLADESWTWNEKTQVGESGASLSTKAELNRAEQITFEEASRAQANFLLRRFEKFKWINIEDRDHFQRYIVLPHYTSRILALFKDLCEARTVEYQRFAFTTFQILTGDESRLRPSFAIREALNITLQFRQELITLYNNMKHHMEQVVQKTSIQEVLDHHFDTYKSQIVDKSYHRLKTSDHVSRYRYQILRKVQEWLLDRDLMEETITDGIQSDFYSSREEAEEDLRQSLLTIEEIYSGLDEIFYQIDLRHNQYLRSSYDRARYLSQYQTGVTQQLGTLLELLSKRAEILGLKANIEYKAVRLFRMHHIGQVNEGSLYTPRKQRQPHQPEKHIVINMESELKEELRRANLEKIRRSITRKKVERFVLERMGERQKMDMQELIPQTVEELLLLTYVYLYGQDDASSFYLERNMDRVIVTIGPYRYHNHNIVRADRQIRE